MKNECFLDPEVAISCVDQKETCRKCDQCLNTKFLVKCVKCSAAYHGSYLNNFTNDMLSMIFLCPECLKNEFPEEIHVCNKCNEYQTKRMDHLECHKETFQKYLCGHCNIDFKNKIWYKSHQKTLQKKERFNQLMQLIKKPIRKPKNEMHVEMRRNHRYLRNKLRIKD